MTHILAVDARMIESSGIGVYTRNILQGLIALHPTWRFRLYGDAKQIAAVFTQPNVEICPLGAKIYSVSEQMAFPGQLGKDVEALWVPHYNIPVFAPVPLFVTVHDIAHLAEPSCQCGLLRKGYAHTLFAAVRHKATHLFFVSEFSRREFTRVIGAPKCPSDITYNAAAPIWQAAAAQPAGPRPQARKYLVFVGNVKPHKNLSRLMQAYQEIGESRDIDLVLIGRQDNFLTGDNEIATLANSMPGRVKFTGRISDAELIGWVRHAEAMVFPSLYEGFGIPPLEAMTVGCPTIVSDIPPLRESCGTASVFVDPHSVADIRRGIVEVLDTPDRRESLRQKGYAHVRNFDFSKAAHTISKAMTAYFQKR